MPVYGNILKRGKLLLIGSERAEKAEQAVKDAVPCLLALELSLEQVADSLGLSLEEVKLIHNF